MDATAIFVPLVGLSYLVWLVSLLFRPGSGPWPFLMTAAATVAWAALTYLEGQLYPLPDSLQAVAGLVRSWTWIWVIDRTIIQFNSASLRQDGSKAPTGFGRLPFQIGSAIAAASVIAVLIVPLTGPLYEPVDNGALGHLCLAITGLLLIENLLSLAPSPARWAVKHMLIGFGAAFAYDLFLYSEAILLKQIGTVTEEVLSLVIAFILPLLWISKRRLRGIQSGIAVSRTVMLRTTALVGSGLYLLAVAGVGFLVQNFGWRWSPALQMGGSIGALLVLAVMLASSQVRARTRWWLSRNFFRLHYDYRSEWLQFVDTMAGEDALAGRLHQRAIKTASDLLDCASGALYLRTRHTGFRLAEDLALSIAHSNGPPPERTLARMQPDAPIVDLTSANLDLTPEETAWRDGIPNCWIVMGLQHRRRIVGAILLASPRVHRPLSWEDRDLLHIFSAQIGSYIAEEQVTLALAEAQRFERVSKNFSFIAHDLKNLVTQLSLIVSQAKRHGDNPAFQADVLSTVADSVEKMRTMLLRLRDVQSNDDQPKLQLIPLGPLVTDLFQRKGALIGRLTVGAMDNSLQVMADPTPLAAVLENLVQNALDAVSTDGQVTVGLLHQTDQDGVEEAVVTIADNGLGMTQAFIDDHLFQPFLSTKETGFGLGMYQCREWMERWRGRLELSSAPGYGTQARVVLPLTGRVGEAA